MSIDPWIQEIIAAQHAANAAEARNEGVRSPVDVDEEVTERLAGHGGIIGERDWADPFLAELAASIEWSVRRWGVQETARQHPIMLAVHLVVVANREYADREMWSAFPWMTNVAHRLAAGQAFERAIVLRGLEPFRGLRAEGALRYVAPILAHGGIPQSLLSTFFRGLLLPALARGEGSTAEELIGRWRSVEPTGIPRPVSRFLRYGGAPAVDFVARCIDLTELDRSSLITDASIAGLPPAVVAAFLAVPEAEVVPPSRAARPLITIDPWDAIGPEVHLPAVGRDRAAAMRWIVEDGTGRREIPASAHVERREPLAPTDGDWIVTSREPAKVRRFVYDATGANEMVSFDADSLAYVRDERGVRADHLWILSSPEVELLSLGSGDASSPLTPAEIGAELVGPWSRYRLARFDLAGVDLIGVRRADEIVATVPVSRTGDGAELVGSPVRDVTSVDGLPIYPAMPTIALPAWGTWQVSLIEAGGRQLSFAVRPGSTRATVDLAERFGTVSLGSFELTARGPLGKDLRVAFAVIAGLTVDTPDQVLAPDSGAINVPLSTQPPVDLPGTGRPSVVTIDAGQNATEIWAWERRIAKLGFLIRVPRLRWGLRKADGSMTLGTTTVDLDPDELGISIRALVVATGRRGALVRAVLDGTGEALPQETRSRPAGIDGNAAVELVALRDAARAASGDLRLFLEVGEHRVVVAQRVARRPTQALRALDRRGVLPPLGSKVTCRIVSISTGALGVAGESWTGVIHADRLVGRPTDHAVGEQIEAWVTRNNEHDRIALDMKPFDASQFPAGREVTGTVRNPTPSGLWIEIEGVRGFVATERLARRPESYRPGEAVTGRVLDVSEQMRSVRLTIRPFDVAAWRTGDTVLGRVNRAAGEGLWVDVGESLAHIRASELPEGRTRADFRDGTQIEAKVISVDSRREVAELSLRIFAPGVSVGDVVEGRIFRVNPTNVLVRLPSGAVGGMALGAVHDALAYTLTVGAALRVRILWINPELRRIGLAPASGGDFAFGDSDAPESPFSVLRSLDRTEPDR
jgi:hypothetical protein